MSNTFLNSKVKILAIPKVQEIFEVLFTCQLLVNTCATMYKIPKSVLFFNSQRN